MGVVKTTTLRSGPTQKAPGGMGVAATMIYLVTACPGLPREAGVAQARALP